MDDWGRQGTWWSPRIRRNILEPKVTCYDDEEDIASILTSFYKSLFTWSSHIGVEEDTNFVKGWVNEEMCDTLNVDFTMEEIFEALHQMHATKAPGVDRTSTLFYQHFWDLVDPNVCTTIMNILNEGGDPAKLNKTLIALIPKVKRPSHAGELRPISLCNAGRA